MTRRSRKPLILLDHGIENAEVGLNVKRPQIVEKLTGKLIYEKLPPDVFDELQKKNPPTPKGYRRHKHHQFLTEDVGDPHLANQLASVTTLMRISPNWRVFEGILLGHFLLVRNKGNYLTWTRVMNKGRWLHLFRAKRKKLRRLLGQ